MNYKKNNEGYLDKTAYTAMKNINKDTERFNKLLQMVFYMCDIAGFKIDGRVTFIDKETGRIWR